MSAPTAQLERPSTGAEAAVRDPLAGFDWKRRGSAGWLPLKGELDRGTALRLGGALEELVHDPGLREIFVDMSGVEVLDMTTPRVLLHCHWALRPSGGGVRVLSPSKQARRAIRWCGATELLERP